ncbi:hypothetical protein Pmani_013402 [Petrolisthes manimaculis]|uniref:HAT C-terminal dimerisation domain-containing protein n=1 Tax=Petrolisthes manimaculis TaxID=1843537 RepID=A0AAE1PYV1_9EUCA|nr:hypothetical protein Pmani_013402 [Petrolisthes manimaculis]
MSPNRQKSYAEFQKFVDVDTHRILKPKASDKSSLQAERILKALNSTYVKVTLEFCDYVLGDLTGLNLIFQSNGFQLHRLVTEVERVVKILCQNFRKPIQNLTDINVDDESWWLPLNKVYPGILAEESMKLMLPHERESFQRRCRDWCREAVRQILQRIDLSDPVLKALKDVNHVKILDASADVKSGSVLARGFPRISSSKVQTIDRQWRSVLIDDNVKKGGWESKPIVEFWQGMSRLPEYEDVTIFMLQMTALPQSTAEVERTFSKLNANKTKLRNSLAVQTLEAIIKTAETFPSQVDVNARLAHLHSNARKRYMEKYTEQEQTEDFQ